MLSYDCNFKTLVIKIDVLGVNMTSAWLEAISALDRRLSARNMTLKEYMTLAFLNENSNVTEEELAMFASHNEDAHFGKSIIARLLDASYLTRDETSNAITVTEHGHNVVEEVHRLCKSRLIMPLFSNPNH